MKPDPSPCLYRLRSIELVLDCIRGGKDHTNCRPLLLGMDQKRQEATLAELREQRRIKEEDDEA